MSGCLFETRCRTALKRTPVPYAGVRNRAPWTKQLSAKLGAYLSRRIGGGMDVLYRQRETRRWLRLSFSACNSAAIATNDDALLQSPPYVIRRSANSRNSLRCTTWLERHFIGRRLHKVLVVRRQTELDAESRILRVRLNGQTTWARHSVGGRHCSVSYTNLSAFVATL